jgi:hypothetical protein
MKHSHKHSIEELLSRLQYDLEYLNQFAGRPCWVTYEYKFYVISSGIAILEGLKNKLAQKDNEKVNNMLAQYRIAHQTII